MRPEAISRSAAINKKVTDHTSSKVTPLRAGIIGAGLMGRWHVEAIKRSGGRLVAVTDVDFGAAKRLAAGHAGAYSFSNLNEMLGQDSLDVLHICTPASTHNSIAERAIDAGLNLIIEKPITPTVRDTERLFDRAFERGVLICPVHQFMFQDGVLNARELLPQIGELVHIEGTFCSAGGAKMTREQLDMVVADILPHPLSLMQMFLPLGLPEDWVVVRPRYGELRAICQASNASLSIFISLSGQLKLR